jgi:hypothetical protein
MEMSSGHWDNFNFILHYFDDIATVQPAMRSLDTKGTGKVVPVLN